MAHPSEETVCPICKVKVKLLDRTGDATGYECVNHGRFKVAGSVPATSASREASQETWERALERAKARQPGAWAPLIESSDLT